MIIFLVALEMANVLQLETALIFSGRILLVRERISAFELAGCSCMAFLYGRIFFILFLSEAAHMPPNVKCL